MADTNPALETTQRETIPLLTKIRDGLMIATSNAAPETENDHIASLDIDLERTVVVRPFASKKR